MENSVTLTLSRYHDLIDIEQEFDQRVKETVENKKFLHDLAVEIREKTFSDLRLENDNLEKELEQSKRINFYIGGAFIMSLILLISSIFLQ